MKPEHKKYILENIRKKSIKEKENKDQIDSKKETVSPSFKKRIAIISVILIIILGFTVYGNSIKGEFVWDDNWAIKNNLYIRNWSNIGRFLSGSISSDSRSKDFHFYRPLHMITYILDYSLWKLDVRGYHLLNTLWHTLVALAIYWLVNILFGDRLLSFLTSIFYIAHPVHLEAVTWITGRSDSMAAFFLLLSFIFYIKVLRDEKIGFYIIMALAYIGSLLSRESTFILPLLILLYHYAFQKKVSLRKFSPFIVITLLYILLRLTLLRFLLGDSTFPASFLQRLAGFFVAIANYVRILILPIHLHVEYGFEFFKMHDPRVIIGLFIYSFLIIFGLKKRKTNTLISFSISWFLITLLPMSNLYPINAYMAEHWLYIPSIGWFFILAKTLTYLYRKKELRTFSVILIPALLCFYSYLTIKYNEYWKEPIPFYERILKYSPFSYRVYNNLGFEYYTVGRHEDAITHYKKALKIKPDYAEAYNNLGVLYNEIGKREEALSLYKKAIEIEPNYVAVYNNLGIAYSAIGEKGKAISSYKKAQELYPEHAISYNNLAAVYRDLGRIDEAISTYKRALEINPDFIEVYYNLGDLYMDTGKIDEAISLYNKLLKIKPDCTQTYNNLGVLYTQIGRAEEAIPLYKKALEIDPNYAEIYGNLAAAYFSIGEKELAISTYKKALQINPGRAEIYNNLGVTSYEMGKIEEAISAYRKALEIKPDYAKVYFGLSEAYLYEKEYDLAVEYCDMAMEYGYNVPEGFLEKLEPYRK